MIERKTFEEHFRSCFELLARYAFAFVGDREESKEIVQEVFASLWERRTVLKITVSLRIYLFQTVKNRSLNHLRDQKKTLFVSCIPDELTEDVDSTPTHSLDDLQIHIQQLPARCREIFILKRVQGLSYKQISLRLDIAEKSVENQMTIAFKKLREAVIEVDRIERANLKSEL
jgi:RNA polymerase sigma-70 factor, ECF subfamily